MPRRFAPPLVLLAALVLTPAASARADSWDAISSRIAASMEALQQPDGSLSDYLSPAAQPYAEAMVGYGLLLRGVRTGDRVAIESGLRALGQTVEPGARGGPMLDSVFKQLAVASAYNLAAAHLAGDPVFETRREALAAWLRQVRPVHLTSAVHGTSNKHLVEAVADLELLRSGLTSDVPGTVLADRAGALLRVQALVELRWPAAVRRASRPGPLGPMAVVSDPPTNPLAYHALSLAMLDRAIGLLGGANRDARDARRRMARASATLAGPDGDLAYWGRSQEQSWALALTAAGVDGLSPAAGYAALRDRLASRIGTVHGFGPFGVWIVPALRGDAAAGRAAMDDYAANGVYNGLTLIGAEWTLASPESGGAAPARPAANRGGAWVLGHGSAAFAVSRRGNAWFAVRMRAAPGGHGSDPRYAFGLVAAKRLGAGGWEDTVGAPPRALTGTGAAGPSLVLPGGTLAQPYGTRMRTSRSGAVDVLGGFRVPGGRVVRRGVRFTFAPTPGGRVAVSMPVRRGDVVEVADFRPAGGDAGPVALRLSGHRAARALHSAPVLGDGFASATLGRVVRVAGRVRAPAAGTLTWVPRA